MSSTVKRHWRREETKMMTGLVGAYSTMARYAGLDMAIISDGKCGMVKLCRCMSIANGLGLKGHRVSHRIQKKKPPAYLGEKLKMACEGAPIHSPKSRALARETPHATIRVLISVCAETYRVREMTTS